MKPVSSFIPAALPACLLFAGCACESKACKEIREAHPDYPILAVRRDGNDTTVVTYVITYNKPDESRRPIAFGACEEKDGGCVLVSKGE